MLRPKPTTQVELVEALQSACGDSLSTLPGWAKSKLVSLLVGHQVGAVVCECHDPLAIAASLLEPVSAPANFRPDPDLVAELRRGDARANRRYTRGPYRRPVGVGR